MKKLNDFIREKQEDPEATDSLESSKDSLITMIASLLNRYKSTDRGDIKSILMLIAALQLLSSGGTSNMTVSTARRLVSVK